MNLARPPQACVLILGDDLRFIKSLRNSLESAGYRAVAVLDVHSMFSVMEVEEPQLILLDLAMSSADGCDTLRQVRRRGATPVILLAADENESDEVRGLNLGADDFVSRPFGMNELLARVSAVLRRAGWPRERELDAPFHCGSLTVDFKARRVMAHGKEVDLSPKEYKLLCELVNHAGKIILHEDLLARIWGPDYREKTSYLRVYVRHLRRKLESDPGAPRHILSKFGIGYMFNEADH